MTGPLLDVCNLSILYGRGAGSVHAVDRIDLCVDAGETLGLVGESGCGKSSVALALMRLLPPSAQIEGEALLDGCDLLSLRPDEMRQMRSRSIGIVFQAAMNALNPVFRVGDQVAEPLLDRGDVARAEARRRVAEMFDLVGLPRDRIDSYPHELSGGMKQRVMIAMALIERPRLVIADEPTTALDVIVQDQILGMMKELQRELSFGLLLISHDMAMISETCDRVDVMYAGRIMEEAPATAAIGRPGHPYTVALMRAHPDLRGPAAEVRSLPGSPPNMRKRIVGCRFAQRCDLRTERCSVEPGLVELGAEHLSRCHYAADVVAQEDVHNVFRAADVADHVASAGEPLLRTRELGKHFALRRSGFTRLAKRSSEVVRAVDGVDLDVQPGEVVGLVGESGCGKSTLGRLLMRLEQPTGGEVRIGGAELAGLSQGELTRRVQMIFQDPYRSLDPRWTVRRIVGEPLRAHGVPSRALAERARRALEDVDLNPVDDFLDRYPHQLSGGQRQRVAIARAIVLEPSLIVADEPVSMLDVSVRAGVMNVLLRMRDQIGVGLVFITHDLGVARHMSDRIAVIYLGRIVELGPAETVLSEPAHPYTRMLLASVPTTRPGRERVRSTDRAASAAAIPTGCRFRDRCPLAISRCAEEDPRLHETGAGHWAACHLA